MAYEVRVPKVTQTMSEATITRWIKSEGDSVRLGEPLLEIVTDKATVEVESPAAGVVGRIIVPEGDVPVGKIIAVILQAGEEMPATFTGAINASPLQERTDAPARLRVSPLARRLAQELGVELSMAVPSGPGGMIVEADVRKLRQAQPAPVATTVAQSIAPAPTPVSVILTEGEEIIHLVGARKTIAERMALSRRTAADVTTVAEVDMGEIAALREHLDFTYTAFAARALALALAEFPILNSRLEENRIIVSKRVHLGVAVAVEDALRVPVIRDAHTKSLLQLSSEIAELAKRGAEGKLTIEQLTGSSFTLTNSGVFGSLMFTPIINPPESAIVGMGKIVKTPVVRDDQIVIRPMMYLCLTYDHRVVDGAPAVKFLQRVKTLLEQPKLLL
jgi:pyruvate/2-oxoglutarate dehydrogenase complex dihydrolipoamide acyltransferase (E2) component